MTKLQMGSPKERRNKLESRQEEAACGPGAPHSGGSSVPGLGAPHSGGSGVPGPGAPGAGSVPPRRGGCGRQAGLSPGQCRS
nr:PREDICTED: myosin heavy chain IB [Struthio camelus australis]